MVGNNIKPMNENNKINKDKNNEQINNKIRASKMVVIDADGKNLGELSKAEALKIAAERELDLVLIVNQPNNVIAKILDYGKYKFEQKRKQKENKKNQAIIKVKEIKVKPLIGEHDLLVRINNAKKWLDSGDKVKFIIESRGRISTKVEFINALYEKFVNSLDGIGTVIQANKQINPYRYETVIVPLKK